MLSANNCPSGLENIFNARKWRPYKGQSFHLCTGEKQPKVNKPSPNMTRFTAPFRCTHPSSPVPPFLLMQNLSSKDIAGSDITTQYYAHFMYCLALYIFVLAWKAFKTIQEGLSWYMLCSHLLTMTTFFNDSVFLGWLFISWSFMFTLEDSEKAEDRESSNWIEYEAMRPSPTGLQQYMVFQIYTRRTSPWGPLYPALDHPPTSWPNT